MDVYYLVVIYFDFCPVAYQSFIVERWIKVNSVSCNVNHSLQEDLALGGAAEIVDNRFAWLPFFEFAENELGAWGGGRLSRLGFLVINIQYELFLLFFHRLFSNLIIIAITKKTSFNYI